MTWAKNQLRLDPRLWGRTIFSDEKRFSLDGPDGEAYYWADKRIEDKTFSKRQQGGGGVMVWGCFCLRGRPELFIVPNTLNSEKYVELLQNTLEPFAEKTFKGSWRYQQDNAPMHNSKYTKEYFMEAEINVIEWPPRSPDLNPIENLWGNLVRSVYADNRQFEYEDDLIEAIKYAWENIDQDLVQKLVDSMTDRCTEVIERRGGKTHY